MTVSSINPCAAPPHLAVQVPARAVPKAVTLADAQRYIGQSYEDGVFDCADFAAQVQRELFGKVLALPPHASRPRGVAGQRREIAALRTTLATALPAVQHGCLVLMQSPGAEGGALVWHIGVALLADGEQWILHNARRLGGVNLQRAADVRMMGTQIEGYYACL